VKKWGILSISFVLKEIKSLRKEFPMTKNVSGSLNFGRKNRHDVVADFNGGLLSSDGGLLLLDGLEKKTGLLAKAAEVFSKFDRREPGKVEHSMLSLTRQRVFGIALGHEDGNDHEALRNDPLYKGLISGDKVKNKDGSLGSPATLSRLENILKGKTRKEAEAFFFAMNSIFVEHFIASFSKAPEEIVLDFDASDATLYGEQEFRFFHGYYEDYCYLPLYVYCGKHLLCAILRPSNIDGAKYAWGVMSFLAKRLREAFPETRLVFRGDSGFCRWKMLRWMEKHSIFYVTGIAGNAVLEKLSKGLQDEAKAAYQATNEKQRLFSEFFYAAKPWDKKRRVIAKAEYNSKGDNNRHVITNLPIENAEDVYDFYIQRGDMENRIKETQLQMFSDRMSCSLFYANFIRLLLSSLAYILVDTLRCEHLKGTALSNAYVSTIRIRLLKIGAQVKVTVRRLRVHLTENFPLQSLFRLVHNSLVPS